MSAKSDVYNALKELNVEGIPTYNTATVEELRALYKETTGSEFEEAPEETSAEQEVIEETSTELEVIEEGFTEPDLETLTGDIVPPAPSIMDEFPDATKETPPQIDLTQEVEPQEDDAEFYRRLTPWYNNEFLTHDSRTGKLFYMGDEILEVDESGRLWVVLERAKRAAAMMPEYRIERVLTMTTTRQRVPAGDGSFTEVDIPGRIVGYTDVRIHTPSYSEGQYYDPRFPFIKLATFQGRTVFDYESAMKFWDGVIPSGVHTEYAGGRLGFNIEETIKAITKMAEQKERGRD